MTPEQKEFYRGWAVCASFIAGPHGMGSLIEDAINEHGITLDLLNQAGIDSYDMNYLRPLLDKRHRQCCVK